MVVVGLVLAFIWGGAFDAAYKEEVKAYQSTLDR